MRPPFRIRVHETPKHMHMHYHPDRPPTHGDFITAKCLNCSSSGMHSGVLSSN